MWGLVCLDTPCHDPEQLASQDGRHPLLKIVLLKEGSGINTPGIQLRCLLFLKNCRSLTGRCIFKELRGSSTAQPFLCVKPTFYKILIISRGTFWSTAWERPGHSEACRAPTSLSLPSRLSTHRTWPRASRERCACATLEQAAVHVSQLGCDHLTGGAR